MPRRASREAGFVITLEMIIIFTILGIGLLAGIFAVRNALFVWLMKQKAQTVWVYDASGRPLGPARDFDEHEAPRLFYIDRDVAEYGDLNYRAMVGVRDDRFTTRHRIFYENTNDCGVTELDTVRACIVHASDEDGDSKGVGIVPLTVSDGTTDSTGSTFVQNAGGIGYLYPLQQGPAYGVGRDVDNLVGLPGTLYRETEDTCDPSVIRSVWTSQDVLSGLPCRALPVGLTVIAAKCPPGADGGNDLGEPCANVPPADSRCVVSGTCSGGLNNGFGCSANAQCPGGTCNTGALQCACPDTADGNPATDWVAFGANCCPPGTTQTAPGQCEIANDGTLRVATEVQLGGANAFSWVTAPFFVNLPPDLDSFSYINPTAEGGAPGSSTGIPYTPADFVFDRAPNDSTELQSQ